MELHIKIARFFIIFPVLAAINCVAEIPSFTFTADPPEKGESGTLVFNVKGTSSMIGENLHTQFIANATVVESGLDMETSAWRAKDGRFFAILYFSGLPKHDRGIMARESEEPVEVGGHNTQLIETKIFFGEKMKALVVYIRLGESCYIIYSTTMTKDEFKRILRGVSISEGSQSTREVEKQQPKRSG